MPSARVWNSGGPPRTRLAAMVSPPRRRELLPLEPLLLPDAPHAVSAVSTTVAPVSARTILCLGMLLFMDVSPGVGRGARCAEAGNPGGGRRSGTADRSAGALLGSGQLRDRSGAA